MKYIDTHFHLDLMPSPEKTLNEIESKKIYTIAVTNAPSVFEFSYELAKNKKYIRAALGLHPQLMIERANELQLFNELLPKTRYVGEIGLDFGGLSQREKELQKEIFAKIINACATLKDKILTIHSRNAVEDILSIVGNNFPGIIILHWYSGNLTNLRRAIDYGYFFSVNYPMITSEKGKKIIKEIPLDRLLTESDGPFVQFKDEAFTPDKIPITVQALSLHLKMSELELAEIVYENFRNILIQK